jgi:hypothetical protein
MQGLRIGKIHMENCHHDPGAANAIGAGHIRDYHPVGLADQEK